MGGGERDVAGVEGDDGEGEAVGEICQGFGFAGIAAEGIGDDQRVAGFGDPGGESLDI